MICQVSNPEQHELKLEGGTIMLVIQLQVLHMETDLWKTWTYWKWIHARLVGKLEEKVAAYIHCRAGRSRGPC